MRALEKQLQCRDIIRNIQEDHVEKDAEARLNAAKFDQLTYAAKQAAKQVGLAFRAGCLQSRNNKQKCRYFFIPGSESDYMENGKNGKFPFLKGLWIFTAKPIAGGKGEERYYKVECVLYTDNTITSYEELAEYFYKARNRAGQKGNDEITLPRQKLEEFFACYIDELSRCGVLSKARGEIVTGWARGHDGRFCCIWALRPELNPGRDMDDLLPIRQYPTDGIWFAATVFSLCKALFTLCKLPHSTDFVLQLLLDTSKEYGKEDTQGLWVLEQQAHYWCDFRDWMKEMGEEEWAEYSKFRCRYDRLPPIGSWANLGFPTVLFNFKKQEEPSDPIEYRITKDGEPVIALKKADLDYLCNGYGLSVLLPALPPKRSYAKKQCLSLDVPLENCQDLCRRWNWGIPRKGHEAVMEYYRLCLRAIDSQPASKVKKGLRESCQRALADLGAASGEETRKDQLACLLGTLYFLRTTLEQKGEKVERLEKLIQAFYREIGGVTTAHFAAFVKQLLQNPAKHANVLFGQEQDGIYLVYQTYWDAFQDFCRRQGVLLSCSAKKFRDSCLLPNRLIQPQYTPSNGGYARYDYRKKLNGKEETVLKVSPDILKF